MVRHCIEYMFILIIFLIVFTSGCTQVIESYTITPQQPTDECVLWGNEQVNVVIHNDISEMEIQK